MRKSTTYLLTTFLAVSLLSLMIGMHPILSRKVTSQRLIAERQLVRRLELTDICLFTEAPHTRHPNMADRFAAFQDHPMAAAHFPSESLIPPPRLLTHARTSSSKDPKP